MKKKIQKYYQSLKEAMRSIRVTDGGRGGFGADGGIQKALYAIESCGACGGKLIFIGNGASAALASHQAVDFWKGTQIPALAFNDAALLTCISNDYGYERVFEKPVSLFLERRDILVAISSSGQSRNILNAVKAARKKKAFVITLTGFAANNPLRTLGNLNFYVPAGSYGLIEVVHHSILHCLLDVLSQHRKMK